MKEEFHMFLQVSSIGATSTSCLTLSISCTVCTHTSNQQQRIDMLPIMRGHPAMSASLRNLERPGAQGPAHGMHMGCQTDLPSMCHIHHIHSVIGIPIQHEVESEEHAVIGHGLGLIQGHKVGVACAYKITHKMHHAHAPAHL